MKMSTLREHNNLFFAKGTKQFFGARSYRILKGKKSDQFYFIQETTAWSEKDVFFKIRPILNTKKGKNKIQPPIQTLYNLKSVKSFLKNL